MNCFLTSYLLLLAITFAVAVFSSGVSSVLLENSRFQTTIAMEEEEAASLSSSSSSLAADGRIGENIASSSNTFTSRSDSESFEDLEVPLLPSPDGDEGGPQDGGEESSKMRTMKLGDTLKLTEAGPMIINPDGTVRRIANWQTLTDAEKESSWRVISKRNQKRIAVLKEKLGKEAKLSQINETPYATISAISAGTNADNSQVQPDL